MSKKNILRIGAAVLAILMPLTTGLVALSVSGADSATQPDTSAKESKYASLDINALTGHGADPEELSVSAGATYQEKAWYEYVMYSDRPVCSYRLDDNTRLVFFDPYTYTNSMVMDVQFDATTTSFDTMSSYTISHTQSKTVNACDESTYTSTHAELTSGKDESHSDVKNTGKTVTDYNHSISVSSQGTVYDETKNHYLAVNVTTHDQSITEALGSKTEIEMSVTGGIKETVEISGSNTDTWHDDIAWLQDSSTHETHYSDNYKTTTAETGTDTVTYDTQSTTDGWTQLAARITKTTGSSQSTSQGWSETESETITKTYAATHFASDGVTPLPWAIVHYSVQMPMKCSLQVMYEGEWVTLSTVYCLLTTVQGTCRAWMQNGQVYYEDWGNGEPVVATDFWSQFMTKDQLMAAYSDKLYPVGGID